MLGARSVIVSEPRHSVRSFIDQSKKVDPKKWLVAKFHLMEVMELEPRILLNLDIFSSILFLSLVILLFAIEHIFLRAYVCEKNRVCKYFFYSSLSSFHIFILVS